MRDARPLSAALRVPSAASVALLSAVFMAALFAACQETSTTDPDADSPPPAPGNVRAAYDTGAEAVRLTWSPVDVPDLDGYLVYRSEAGGTDPRRMNTAPIGDTAYADTIGAASDTADRILSYRLKAQDTQGGLSAAFSDPVIVTVPAPLRSEASIPNAVVAGDTLAVRGFLRSGTALTAMDVSLWRGDTDVTVGKGFAVSYAPPPAGRTSWDFASDAALRIAVGDEVPGARYTLRIAARAGVRSLVDSLGFDVVGGRVAERSLVAGAQANANYGAFIDLDAFRATTTAVATANAADIDLVFAFSTAANGAFIYSPTVAKNGVGGSMGFDFVRGLNPANSTEIKTATAAIGSIRTQSQIDSLWSAGTAVPEGRLLLAPGTVFLAESNRGRIVLVRTGDVNSSASGTAALTGTADFE